MTILIGREEGVERPRLCLRCGDKTAFLGAPGSVGARVSRKHCNLELDDDGKLVSITDITKDNFMFVEGRECKSKVGLKLTDIVELGPDKYRLDLAAIVRLFVEEKPVNASYLRDVYDFYQEDLMRIQIRQGRFNAISSLPMLFSMGSGVLAAYVEEARVIGIVLALVFIVGFAVIRYKMAATLPAERKELDDQFHRDYVCPNCGQFLGNTRPDDLARRGFCPFCKTKLDGI